MNTKSLKELVFSTFRNDTTLIALLGTTTNTPRMYFKYPDVETSQLLSSGSQAYICYFIESTGGRNFSSMSHTYQIGDITLVFDIYASDEAEHILYQIYDRLWTIFQGQSFSNDYWRLIGFMSDNVFRDFEEWDKDQRIIHHRHVRFVSKNAYSKTSLVNGAP